jgi:hypothetical protein
LIWRNQRITTPLGYLASIDRRTSNSILNWRQTYDLDSMALTQ